MAGLKFTFEADVQKLVQTRKEIGKLRKEIEKMPSDSPQIKVLQNRLEKLKEEYSKLESILSKVQLMAKEAAKADDLIKQTQKQTEETGKATDNFKAEADSLAELEKQSKRLTKEWLDMSEAQRKSSTGQGKANEIATINAQRKIELDGLRVLQKEYVNTKKVQDLQEGSIKALRAQLSNLNALYDSLGRGQRNGAYGKELIASIQAVTKELSEAEQASMRFQRNVGNYASGWNGLSVQVQQVARELPSLAFGLQQFTIAISNNLPMLADELQKSRKEFKALKAEGKAATPVWKQFTSSLFSWQTALVAGITLFSVYGKEIISWVGSLFTAKKALSETYQSLEDYQKKVGETSGSVISTLERLSQGWKRLGGDIDAQKKFILENKDAIDSMGVSVNDAAEAERLFNTNKDTFIMGLLQRAKATATMELAAEEYKKAVQKVMEADAMPDKKTYKHYTGTLFHGRWETRSYDNPEKKKAQEQADDFIKSGTELVMKYAQFSEEERKILESMGAKTTQTMIDGSVEAIEAAISLKQQSLKKVTNPKDYKRIEAEIKAEQAKLKAITGEKNKIATSNYIDSYAQSKEIEKASQEIKDTITKSEISIRQKQIDLMADGSEKQLAQIRLDYDKRYDEIQKEERELLQKLQDEERKQWEKENPDFKKKNLQFTTSITSLSPEDRARFDKEYSLAYQKQEKDTQTLLNNLLAKYRDYDAQRTEVERQGNEDIAALQAQRTDANAEEIDRAINVAKDKMKEGIQQVNDAQAAAATKDNSFFKLLFGDVSSMSFGTLQNLIDQAKQLKEYLSGNGDSKGITFISKDQLEAIEKSPAELDKLKKALDKLLGSSSEGSGNKWESIFDTFKKGFAGLQGAKGFKEISGAIGTISGAAENAAGELADMFDQMGNTEVADALNGIQQVMGAVSNIGQGFAKGGLIGGIGAAIGEAANFIGQAFAANARHKAALRAIMNETIAQQREYNLLLMQQNLEYEKATTIFGTDAYGKAANAVKVMKEAVADLKEELAGTTEQKQSQSKDALFKKFFGVSNPQAELKKAYAGLANIEIKTGHKKTGLFGWGKGKDIYSSILDVYPQLVDANGKFDKSLAETIINTREMSDESKAALLNMIDLAQQAEEAYNHLNDYFTDIFGELGGTITDALVDAFSNGTDAAQAFTDSVSDMLEKLAKQMVYSVTLAPLLEKAQKKMMDVMQNTGLSDEQKLDKWTGILNNLVGDAINQQELANRLLEEYQQTAKEQGFDIFKPEGSSQSSTSRGFGTEMTHEDAGELSGRFTALQIAGEEIKNQSIMQTDLLSMINEKMPLITGEANSTGNLPDIAGRAKEAASNSYQSVNIIFPDAKLDSLTKEVSELKVIVNDMRNLQVDGNLERMVISEDVRKMAKNSPKILANTDDMKRSLR
jgi:hypothetical protein